MEIVLINVFVVDDHALVRLGLVRLLEDVSGIKVTGVAGSGEEALQLARQTMPDVVLLDVKMPGIGGLETTRRLIRINTEIKVIALSAFFDHPFPLRILQAGACGYLTKKSSLEELSVALKKVHSGQKYISPEIAQQLALKSLSESASDASPFDQLSERELQVMMMITSGLKVQEISAKLCLSSKTVNSYRYRLFDKLKIKNDVELTHLAIRHGLVDKEVAIES